jgi:SAM-dependent methyltransferase
MLVNRPDKDWEKYGRQDPYFGVVSLDRFHKDQLTPEAVEEFFRSGAEHAEFVFDTIRTHLDSGFRPARAMDFGCGVGRCALPLAKRCGSVVGVDVSPSMIEEARRNSERYGVGNIEWARSDDRLSGVTGQFDLIHSFLVFQHIPRRRGEAIVRQLVEKLADNGVGVLQFLYHRDTPPAKRLLGQLRKYVPLVHNVVNLLYGHPFSYPLMQKNCYDLNRLLNILQKRGCGNVHVRFQGAGELQSAVIFFQKRPDRIPYDDFYRE